MPYNIISCSGFTTEAGGWVASMPCLKGRLGLVILFFLIALVRKWGGEEIGIGFNLWFALILGIIPYFIVITIFGSFKVAMVVGIIGALVGGYGIGMFLGGEE